MTTQLWQLVITSFATLIGAALGVTGTYLVQRSTWQWQYSSRWDEDRRIAYSKILTVCNKWHDAMYTHQMEIIAALSDEFLSLTGEVSLLAGDKTRAAARELGDHLWAVRWGQSPFKEGDQESDEYMKLRDAFRNAARNEMKIS